MQDLRMDNPDAEHLLSLFLGRVIVDEVLAVGDAEFQKKCLGKMSDISRGEGKTVLFVSHNMDAVRKLCKSGVLLKNGTVQVAGNIDVCLNEYVGGSLSKGANVWSRNENIFGPKFIEASLRLSGSQPNLKLTIDFSVNHTEKEERKSFVAIDIKNSYGVTIMQAIPNLTPFITYEEPKKAFKIDIDLIGLVPDNYHVSLWMGPHNSQTFDYVEDIISFEVLETPMLGRTFPHTMDHGFCVPNSKIVHDIK
ncbi:MAG: hypothetical protein EOO43_04600 [Flavobacterium sp.]|nr:MAG: hypothetical protein EOO43_04600 [Flavobacterium sp.]